MNSIVEVHDFAYKLIEIHAHTHETLATFEKVPGHMQQINHTVWYNYVHNYITCAYDIVSTLNI